MFRFGKRSMLNFPYMEEAQMVSSLPPLSHHPSPTKPNQSCSFFPAGASGHHVVIIVYKYHIYWPRCSKYIESAKQDSQLVGIFK